MTKIDRLFRMWDALCYFRATDSKNHGYGIKGHLHTRNWLATTLANEFGVKRVTLSVRPIVVVGGCIMITKSRQRRPDG